MARMNRKTKVMVVLGTRPEAIKAAPIIDRLRRRKSDFEPIIVTISYAREVLDHVLTLFNADADIAFDLTRIRQGLPSLTSHVLENMTIALDSEKPDLLLTEGNSAPVFASLIAAFHQKIPVARISSQAVFHHRENQTPEDVNRRLTAVMADIHFAATHFTKECLIKEGAPENKIFVTGNPLIDAWNHLSIPSFVFPSPSLQRTIECGKRIVLFAIRSEQPARHEWQAICKSASTLVSQFTDVEAVIALPSGAEADGLFDAPGQARKRIHLIAAPDEVTFVNLLKHSYLIVTDANQIPEEASAFQKPVLILTNSPSKGFGIDSLSSKNVSSDASAIIRETGLLLRNRKAYLKMQDLDNPYGDGQAADRIVTALKRWSRDQQRLLTPAEEFSPGTAFTERLCQNL